MLPGERRIFVDTLAGMTDRRPARPGRPGTRLMAAGVRVTSLHRYPVKACAGEPLDVVEVRVDGLRHDRGLAVVAGRRGRSPSASTRCSPASARSSTTRPPASPCRTTGAHPVDALVDTSGRTRRGHACSTSRVAVVDQAPELSRLVR